RSRRVGGPRPRGSGRRIRRVSRRSSSASAPTRSSSGSRTPFATTRAHRPCGRRKEQPEMSTTATAPIAQYHDEQRCPEERKTGIGGSEVAAIFGEHPFLTARELWERKTGRAVEQPETPAMRRGRLLEDVAAQLYSEETGRQLRRQPLRRHREHSFLLAS